jgi:hypothetical protein
MKHQGRPGEISDQVSEKVNFIQVLRKGVSKLHGCVGRTFWTEDTVRAKVLVGGEYACVFKQ